MNRIVLNVNYAMSVDGNEDLVQLLEYSQDHIECNYIWGNK